MKIYFTIIMSVLFTSSIFCNDNNSLQSETSKDTNLSKTLIPNKNISSKIDADLLKDKISKMIKSGFINPDKNNIKIIPLPKANAKNRNLQLLPNYKDGSLKYIPIRK